MSQDPEVGGERIRFAPGTYGAPITTNLDGRVTVTFRLVPPPEPTCDETGLGTYIAYADGIWWDVVRFAQDSPPESAPGVRPLDDQDYLLDPLTHDHRTPAGGTLARRCSAHERQAYVNGLRTYRAAMELAGEVRGRPVVTGGRVQRTSLIDGGKVDQLQAAVQMNGGSIVPESENVLTGTVLFTFENRLPDDPDALDGPGEGSRLLVCDQGRWKEVVMQDEELGAVANAFDPTAVLRDISTGEPETKDITGLQTLHVDNRAYLGYRTRLWAADSAVALFHDALVDKGEIIKEPKTGRWSGEVNRNFRARLNQAMHDAGMNPLFADTPALSPAANEILRPEAARGQVSAPELG